MAARQIIDNGIGHASPASAQGFRTRAECTAARTAAIFHRTTRLAPLALPARRAPGQVSGTERARNADKNLEPMRPSALSCAVKPRWGKEMSGLTRRVRAQLCLEPKIIALLLPTNVNYSTRQSTPAHAVGRGSGPQPESRLARDERPPSALSSTSHVASPSAYCGPKGPKGMPNGHRDRPSWVVLM